jgi:hypothetical protein
LTDERESGELRPRDSRGSSPWRVISQWVSFGRNSRLAERTSAELTTQPNAGRGYALREAHRTLRQHFEQHPALLQITPQLATLERALARQGSRALLKLPPQVLRQSLEQLAMLQAEDASTEDSSNLRVLRLRLIEALTQRAQRPGQADELRHHEVLRGAGVEVRHISEDEFNRAVHDSRPPANGRSRH